MEIYLALFLTFFKIGLFSFGGGYAVLSLIQEEVIQKHAWVSLSEFTEIVAVSQITPGPIGINSATYIGYKVTGNVLGAICSTAGVVFPSVCLLLSILFFIHKFRTSRFVTRMFQSLRPIVLGLILGAGFLLLKQENFPTPISYLIFICTFCLGVFTKWSPIWLIFLSALLGFVLP